jgi:hypothetical protein
MIYIFSKQPAEKLPRPGTISDGEGRQTLENFLSQFEATLDSAPFFNKIRQLKHLVNLCNDSFAILKLIM